MTFFPSTHCTSNIHCKTCRALDDTGNAFRLSLMNRFDDILLRDFECPVGRSWNYDGLGDKVERAVKPIAKLLKMPCLDDKSQLKPESPCAKRRGLLNQLS